MATTIQDIPVEILNIILSGCEPTEPDPYSFVSPVWHKLRQGDDSKLVEDAQSTFHDAAYTGNKSLLKWCLEVTAQRKIEDRYEADIIYHTITVTRRWPADICEILAEMGHLDLLKWARKRGASWGNVCECAASGNQLECLQWAYSQGASLSKQVGIYLASNGNIEGIKWVHKQGVQLKSSACANAARNGHLACLQWLREHDCQWDHRTCESAVEGQHLDVLEWARRNGCSWDYHAMCHLATISGSIAIVEYLLDSVDTISHSSMMMNYIASNGTREMLEWTQARYMSWSTEAFTRATVKQSIETLEWMREQGCPWDEDTWRTACSVGRKDVKEWLKANGVPGSDMDYPAI